MIRAVQKIPRRDPDTRERKVTGEESDNEAMRFAMDAEYNAGRHPAKRTVPFIVVRP